MKKILLTNHYEGEPLRILESVVPEGFRVVVLDRPDREELLRKIPEADYLLVSGRLPVDAPTLSRAPRLKMVQRTGVGTEMLDLEALAKKNIPVYVNAGINAGSVAEHTVTLILASLKRLPSVNAAVHGGIWKKQETGVRCRELAGKTVGLVGMGNIGRRVAAMLNAFSCRILYTDVFRSDAKVEEDLALTYCPDLASLVPEVDILSFHCPLTAENRHCLDAAQIARMKPGAVVVNTARGKLIDSQALANALREGRIGAVALDVHEDEPIPEDYPFLHMEQAILTPHIGGLSREAFASMMHGAMDNIRRYDAGDREAIRSKKLMI